MVMGKVLVWLRQGRTVGISPLCLGVASYAAALTLTLLAAVLLL